MSEVVTWTVEEAAAMFLQHALEFTELAVQAKPTDVVVTVGAVRAGGPPERA